MLIKCGSVDVTNRVLSCIKKGSFSDKRIIGQVPSFQLELKLNNKDDFFNDQLNELFYYTESGSTKEYVFVAYEKPERYTKELSLKLYDRSYELDVAYATQLDYVNNQVTILDQLSEIEQLTGFSFDIINVPTHVLEQIVKWYDNTIPIRNYLGWIAELFAANVFAEGANTFQFVPLSKVARHKTAMVSDYQKDELFTISRVCFDNSAIKAEKGSTEHNTLYISNNNLYVDDDNKDSIVSEVYNVVKGLSVYSLKSFKTKNIVDLMLGDIINYNDEFHVMVLDISSKATSLATIVQNLKGEMVSKNEEKQVNRIDNTTRIRALRVVFDQEKLKWSVTAQEVEGQNEKIAKLELSTDEIKQSISKVEETVLNIDTTFYHAELTCSGTSITRDNSSITMSVKLLDKSDEVATSDSVFNWKRVSSNAESDTAWNNAHKGKKSITITSSDLEASANFYCDVSAPEWQGSTSAVTVVDEVKSQVPTGMLTPNLPTTQTLDENGKVTPKWGLEIIPSMTFGIFSPDIAEIETVWKRRINNDPLTDLTSKEVVADNILTVTGDILSDSVRSVTYYCYMQYEYSTCMAEKTFTLVKDGQSGTDGISIVSTATMYAVNNSDEVPPSSGWITSRPSRSAGQFMWRKMRITYSDGTQTETEAECVTGDKGDKGDRGEQGLRGLQGIKGEQGIPGVKGTDGKTSYTHIAYANSADGRTDFSVSDSNREFVGMYVDFVATDSTDPSKYSWSKIKGADGAQGTPGKAGADGKTPYLHIAYANNATGTSGFSTTDSTNKLYIGQYTDYISADSTDPTKYAWSKIKGETGPQGPQGALGPILSEGNCLYKDPTFVDGINSIKVYNNSGNGTVTNTRIASSDDCPTQSEYMLEIKNTGASSPGCGGFSWQNTARANAAFIYRIIAKIPVGRSLVWASNATGTGTSQKWLTSVAGTGKFQEYLCQLTCGSTGSFSSTGFFYINGAVGTASAPVLWYLAYATCYDMTDVPLIDVQKAINDATNNATTEINKSITATNLRVDTINTSLQTISKTVTKTSEDLSITSSKVLSIESTVNSHKLSISKIDTIEDNVNKKIDKKELEVYCEFTENNNSPQLRLGSSATDTQSYITDNGFRVEYKGVVKTKVDASGLIADTVILKKADFGDNHAIYKNDKNLLIIQ